MSPKQRELLNASASFTVYSFIVVTAAIMRESNRPLWLIMVMMGLALISLSYLSYRAK